MLLRPYQIRTLQQMKKNAKALCIAPTGSGKSIMIGKLVEMSGIKSLIIVTTTKLKQQMRDMIRDFDIPGVQILDNRKEIKTECMCYIATWQTLTSKCAKIPQGLQMIISDEAHHISDMTEYGKLINKINPEFHYAFTATAMRYDGIEDLIKLCDNNNVKIEYEELYNSGFLHRPVVSFISTHKYFNIEHYLNEWQKAKFSDTQKLGMLRKIIGSNKGRNLELYHNISNRLGKHTLVLSYTIEQCQYLYKMFYRDNVDADIDVLLVHGRRSREVKDNFHSRVIKAEKSIIFATQSFLGEGVDIPKLDTLHITSPFGGGAKTIQFSGRILRPYKGKKDVRIFDYYDKMDGIGKHWLRARKAQYKKLNARFV